MNPKKKEIRSLRVSQRHIPVPLRKQIGVNRYLNILFLIANDNEKRIRYNYLKLNNGFKCSGESKMISNLNKRTYGSNKVLEKVQRKRRRKLDPSSV